MVAQGTAVAERAETFGGTRDGVMADAVLSRQQIVDRILTLNTSATVEFLDGFSDRALSTYLAHLVAAQAPRGRGARWVRPGDSAAIVYRESRD